MKKFLDGKSDTDLSDAFKVGTIVADVFANFMACDRGKTPSFATMDDYDATDAFTANRLLDSFGMQLVLRAEADPKLPQEPWQGVGALRWMTSRMKIRRLPNYPRCQVGAPQKCISAHLLHTEARKRAAFCLLSEGR